MAIVMHRLVQGCRLLPILLRYFGDGACLLGYGNKLPNRLASRSIATPVTSSLKRRISTRKFGLSTIRHLLICIVSTYSLPCMNEPNSLACSSSLGRGSSLLTLREPKLRRNPASRLAQTSLWRLMVYGRNVALSSRGAMTHLVLRAT